MRMSMRRFTRLTNAFSKKVENLHASVALHFAHYNFVRLHETLRCTPAMAANVSDRLWSLEELMEQTSMPSCPRARPTRERRLGRFNSAPSRRVHFAAAERRADKTLGLRCVLETLLAGMEAGDPVMNLQLFETRVGVGALRRRPRAALTEMASDGQIDRARDLAAEDEPGQDCPRVGIENRGQERAAIRMERPVEDL